MVPVNCYNLLVDGPVLTTRSEMDPNLRDSLISPYMLGYLRDKLADLSYHAVGLRVEELLKFLTLAAKCEAGPLPISPELDELWHLFILETQEYASICAKLGKFIHHTALNSAQHDTLAHVDFASPVYCILRKGVWSVFSRCLFLLDCRRTAYGLFIS